MRETVEDFGDKRAPEDRLRWLDHPSHIGWSELAWRDRGAAPAGESAVPDTADFAAAAATAGVDPALLASALIERPLAGPDAGAITAGPQSPSAPIFSDEAWGDAAYPSSASAAHGEAPVVGEASAASAPTETAALDAASGSSASGGGPAGGGHVSGGPVSGEHSGGAGVSASTPGATTALGVDDASLGFDWTGGAHLDIDLDIDVSQMLVFTQDIFIDVVVGRDWFETGAGGLSEIVTDLIDGATGAFELDDFLPQDLLDPFQELLGPSWFDQFADQFPLEAFDTVKIDLDLDLARDIEVVQNVHVNIRVGDGADLYIDELTTATRDAAAQPATDEPAPAPIVDESGAA